MHNRRDSFVSVRLYTAPFEGIFQARKLCVNTTMAPIKLNRSMNEVFVMKPKQSSDVASAVFAYSKTMQLCGNT